MADSKISALPANAGLVGTDLFPMVDDPAGTPETQKATISQIRDYLLALANTWTATQTITPAANTNALAVTGYSLTGSNAQSLIDLAGTWNTSGTPTALKLNITDTASNASSLLMDLQVGGASRFRVARDGNPRLAGNGTAWVLDGTSVANNLLFSANGVSNVAGADFAGLRAISVQFAATMAAANDLILARDAANTLAQRNGTNAQAFRLYNTWTDASNGEWLSLGWSGNVATIQTTGNGTGSTVRSLTIGNTTAPTTIISSSGGLSLTTGGGTFVLSREAVSTGALQVNNLIWPTGMYLLERTAPSAPPANTVVIYAVDNGSGKTQLMALFPTGAAQQIAIEP